MCGLIQTDIQQIFYQLVEVEDELDELEIFANDDEVEGLDEQQSVTTIQQKNEFMVQLYEVGEVQRLDITQQTVDND